MPSTKDGGYTIDDSTLQPYKLIKKNKKTANSKKQSTKSKKNKK